MTVNLSHLSAPARRPRTAGFTLVELMVTLVVLALVVGTIAAIVVRVGSSRDRTSHRAETVQAARGHGSHGP